MNFPLSLLTRERHYDMLRTKIDMWLTSYFVFENNWEIRKKNLFLSAEKMPKQTRKSSRNWTKVETNLFCKILIDPINNFMKTLQWKALIKTLTKEVYGLIAAGMRRAMKAEPFLSRNAACRKIKGNLLCHSIPTTSNYKQNTTK